MLAQDRLASYLLLVLIGRTYLIEQYLQMFLIIKYQATRSKLQILTFLHLSLSTYLFNYQNPPIVYPS